MNYGAQLNAWRDEWEKSEELRFQYPLCNDLLYRRLREAWDASPDLQREYAGDYTAFKTASKKEGGSLLVAARDKASRDAAKRQAEHGVNVFGGVRRLTRYLLRKE